MARDQYNIYFYVKTAEDLSPKSDPNWMRLFIDIDRDKSTGWEGYDFLINRTSPGDSAVIEKSTSDWNWTKVGTAEYAIQDNKMELKVNKSALNLNNNSFLDFEFKWSDNMQTDGDIMDFYVNGDVAPGGRFNFVYTTDNATGVGDNKTMPDGYSLLQNYPNPFNPTTKIHYTLPNSGYVQLSIFNIIGNKIANLVDQFKPAGSHTVSWDGSAYTSGEYLCQIKTGGYTQTKKMLLVK